MIFMPGLGVYPIMHLAVMRKAILKDNPWIARNLYKAFDQSRRQVSPACGAPATSPLPGHGEQAGRESVRRRLLSIWDQQNRKALELFLRYAHEQGISRRLMTPEEIFPPGIDIKVAV